MNTHPALEPPEVVETSLRPYEGQVSPQSGGVATRTGLEPAFSTLTGWRLDLLWPPGHIVVIQLSKMAGRQGVEPCHRGLEPRVRSRRATYIKKPRPRPEPGTGFVPWSGRRGLHIPALRAHFHPGDRVGRLGCGLPRKHGTVLVWVLHPLSEPTQWPTPRGKSNSF